MPMAAAVAHSSQNKIRVLFQEKKQEVAEVMTASIGKFIFALNATNSWSETEINLMANELIAEFANTNHSIETIVLFLWHLRTCKAPFETLELKGLSIREILRQLNIFVEWQKQQYALFLESEAQKPDFLQLWAKRNLERMKALAFTIKANNPAIKTINDLPEAKRKQWNEMYKTLTIAATKINSMPNANMALSKMMEKAPEKIKKSFQEMAKKAEEKTATIANRNSKPKKDSAITMQSEITRLTGLILAKNDGDIDEAKELLNDFLAEWKPSNAQELKKIIDEKFKA